MTASAKPVERTSVLVFRVRFYETDLMGIVHHANYFRYFELGRVDYLKRRGITYADSIAKGLHLPVVSADARFRAPLRFDDEVSMTTRLTSLRSHSLVFEYELARGDVAVASGETRLAMVDAEHKLIRIPPEMVEALRE